MKSLVRCLFIVPPEVYTMSRCIAFTKADKPCSNYCQVTHRRDGRVIVHPTCCSHKNYFSTNKMQRDWECMIVTQLYCEYNRNFVTSIRKSILYILLKAVEQGVINPSVCKKVKYILLNVKDTFITDYEKVMKSL